MKKARSSVWFRIPVIIVALLTIWVWQRITVVKMIRGNDLLRAEVQVKRETKEKISADLTRLVQQGRIEQIATESLGLTPTRPGQQRIFMPREFRKESMELDGWQRLNNSWKKLTVASVGHVIGDEGTQ